MSGSPSWILSAFWLSCLLGSAACRRGRGHGGHHSPIIFNDFCAMKDESGPCKAIKERFFFDVNTGSCERFEYGGCSGNANNFETMEECEEACVFSDDKNPCHLPEAPGPCRGLVRRFFFDSQTQQCRHFYYGGCFGNANNFRSMADCQAKCLNPDEPAAAADVHVRKPAVTRPTIAAEELTVSEPQVQLNASDSQRDFSASEICFSPIDRGSCSDTVKRFAFNPATKRCQSFTYSGCGGNQNNFLSRKNCYHKCIKGHKGSRNGMIRIRKKNINSIVNRGD
ncbi:tissue factor pathway inhibitor a isoform X1 [Poecilia latipinna]|uniref:Tissue factor pathway inhibitor n=1 Tax=Poecilia latipinna TaxID=48699 RepID=A0A3B3TR66_9TELE|nr:PREDICTED: tissue factor pathway inhibitor-like isoform X1 [Poecilia latipinna]